VEPSGSRKRASVGEDSASSGKKPKRPQAKQVSKRQGAATASEGYGCVRTEAQRWVFQYASTS
jgi:hypothetical protein